MANRLRGEITAHLDGRQWTLVLTLGALAELEAGLKCSDLQGLVDRFASARLSAGDLIKVIGAGLRGAGHEVSDAQVGLMTSVGGAAGFAAICSDLLAVTFGPDTAADEDASEDLAEVGETPAVPFPGKT
ncbi:MAG: gene transfer agent family protein [Rhodobacteraceae bacterium]|nr:gene transfer agent family protein [Paracoccaceae bacterium]